MSEDKLIEIWLNPLQLLEVDESRTSHAKQPDAETLLEFMCTPGISANLEGLISRYREISIEKRRLFAAPYEERILEKLVWPLRNAKASYMVGNYLGTISLCGMVAEMVAILFFEISDFKINDQPMTLTNQKALFGSDFEKLSQHRRVQILHTYNIIDDEIKTAFDLIRTKRRRYLHLWSQDHDRLPGDAVEIYNATVSIVVNIIGQDVQKGKLLLNPALVRYLDRSGIYEPEDDNVTES